ncbi:MAG: hypothetical protein COZ86_04865 [Candidatus Moranbacteria bacterium CG_4_8_14_3_um_filter_41_13]|nr:MAG: hypothetical protein COX32_00910 [Candidatus Moranbacteria bacterium CG23_combo_of_CG06-09_8_20_14_all_41_28]PIW93723.1 MAG: hypothetical protein COZ86_04865 [Candidatus Moranbacteria bacterium CG_4_8_14_3_um_filter_41_13]
MFLKKYPIPCESGSLVERLEGEIRLLTKLVVSQAKEISDLRSNMFIEPLSLLYTRKGMEHKMHSILAVDRRNNQKNVLKHCAVILIDLDDFKTINDLQSHHIGDIVIQQVGKDIRECFREGDICARWGGDEFVVIVQDAYIHLVKSQIETLRQKLALIPITASIGAVQLSEPITHDEKLFWKKVEEAIKRADNAMYVGKRFGKNRVVYC